MARKGILPRRKRGRASTTSADIEDINISPHNQQANTLDADSCNANALNAEQS